MTIIITIEVVVRMTAIMKKTNSNNKVTIMIVMIMALGQNRVLGFQSWIAPGLGFCRFGSLTNQTGFR